MKEGEEGQGEVAHGAPTTQQVKEFIDRCVEYNDTSKVTPTDFMSAVRQRWGDDLHSRWA